MTQHEIPAHIDQLRFSDRAAWLHARGRDITASVAGALFGVHEYSSPYELWAEKSGRVFPDELDSPALERGELLEPVAVKLLRRKRPKWRITHNTGTDTIYFRDPVNRIGATPDTLVICPERGPGTVQIKSVEKSVYRRKWTPEGSDPEPPLWIAIQAIVEAHMTGSRWACVAPLVVGYGIEMPIIDIPLVEDVVPALIDKTADFWSLVESGEEPPADYSRDREVIEAMNPADDGGEVDLVSDRRAYALIEERAAIQDGIKAHEARRDEIDAELKHKMRGAALAYLPNGMRMTWRTHRKTGPDGRQSVYRVLRVPRPPELVLPPEPAAEPAPAPPKRQQDEPWNF